MVKRKLIQAITLSQLRRHLGNSRTVRRFAERHDLVYFGSVSAADESRLVKGLTLSRTQRDQHYCVGTVFGRDMIFLQRSDTRRSATAKRSEHYVWNILALDVNERLALPHTYIEGKGRYGRAFYESFSMTHRELVEMPAHLMAGYDPLFAERFTCRTTVVHAAELPSYLTPLSAATLAHHFSMFDVEWQDDVLYIYYLSRQPSLTTLDHLLKCGIWLAGELEQLQDLRAEN